MTQQVEKYKVVSITYRILDEQRTVVEQSDLPVDYLHGMDDRMFPKVTQALEGKTVGDTVEVVLPPEEGFGPSDPDLIFTDDLENAPPEFRRLGAKPSFQNEAGETMEMTVTKIEDGKITVDGNHPFAGKTMIFSVTVTAIRDALEAEIGQGAVLQSSNPTTIH